MIGPKVQRGINPIPEMKRITTAEEMLHVLMELIGQDKKNREKNGQKGFAIAVSERLFKGMELGEQCGLHFLIKDAGYEQIHYKRLSQFGKRYKLIIPVEYWKETRDNIRYQRGTKKLQECILYRLRKESIKVTLIG